MLSVLHAKRKPHLNGNSQVPWQPVVCSEVKTSGAACQILQHIVADILPKTTLTSRTWIYRKTQQCRASLREMNEPNGIFPNTS